MGGVHPESAEGMDKACLIFLKSNTDTGSLLMARKKAPKNVFDRTVIIESGKSDGPVNAHPGVFGRSDNGFWLFLPYNQEAFESDLMKNDGVDK